MNKRPGMFNDALNGLSAAITILILDKLNRIHETRNVANQRGEGGEFIKGLESKNLIQAIIWNRVPYERVNENFMQVHPILFTVFLINLPKARGKGGERERERLDLSRQ